MIFDWDAGEIDLPERGAFIAGSASNDAKTLVDHWSLVKDDELGKIGDESVDIDDCEGFVFKEAFGKI